MKKEKRDILFNCQYFYPEYVTAASLAFDAAKALSKAGFTVDALCGYPKEYCNEKGLSAAKIIIVSDGFHLFRTKLLAKKQGIKIAGYGAAFTPSVDFPVQWVRELLAILDLVMRNFFN
jgi:hypothetical protein